MIRARRGGRDRINCGPGDDTVFVNDAATGRATARRCVPLALAVSQATGLSTMIVRSCSS